MRSEAKKSEAKPALFALLMNEKSPHPFSIVSWRKK